MSFFTEVQKFCAASEYLIALNPALSKDQRLLVLYYCEEVAKKFAEAES